MLLRVLFVLMIACMPLSVMAETRGFEGFSIGGDIGTSVNASKGKSNYSYTNLFAAAADASTNDSMSYKGKNNGNFVGDVYADYNLPLTQKTYLGFGPTLFFQDSMKLKSGSYGFANPNSRADFPSDYNVTTLIEPETHVSFGIKPGYEFSENVLGYFSLAYHYMKANITHTTAVNKSRLNAATTINENSTTGDFNGLGLGAGVKYKLNSHWSLNFFTEWIGFNSRKVAGPSLTSVPDEVTFTQNEKITPRWVDFKIGLSYKF